MRGGCSILLKAIMELSAAGELTPGEKSFLKDMVIDQNPSLMWAASVFEATNDDDGVRV